ncbi:hypothetical protein CX676_22360 (plasmid) [Paracoccus zhejiangensis]|uniref:Glycosyltransferase 2-like domain-containing protein n=1 Tax=Paracoccus zhejiangensis TaxID=1077935 RepID=A0A2H5F689_9RHOB|nr:hypothetical protein CX676_22360 [Paracoccus zhejiangensis]
MALPCETEARGLALGEARTHPNPSPGPTEAQILLTSILIPVFNEADHLADCLGSIRAMPDCEIEVILVDDHSTDATYQIACDIAAARGDLPITVLRNRGQGKAAALNLAYRHAKGDGFVLLAGDDLLVSEVLPARIAAVAGPQPTVALCRYRSFSDIPAHDGTLFPRPGREDHLAGGATSFNRAFAELYFPIPEELPNEDSWLRAIAILFCLPVTFIDRIGLHYRIHDRNSTGPSLDFALTNEGLARRHAAFSLALERFDGATAAGRDRLATLVQAEARRSAGDWLGVLRLKHLPAGDRSIFLANSTPWLFWIKGQLLQILNRRNRRSRSAGRNVTPR